jgi:hypothetical protein
MSLESGPGSPEEPAQTAKPTLVFKGLRVPYIAAWSSETSDLTGDPALVLRTNYATGQQYLVFLDEGPGDREHGVLWGRMPNTPGVGQAQFASLHGTRQREVMARGGCQVCGGPGEVWMVPASVWGQYLQVRGEGAPYDTSDPPICRSCIPVATRQCPNLSTSGFLFLAPRKWTITGVRGFIGNPATGEFGPERDVPLHGAVGFDATRLRLTLGKGLLATLRGITVHTDPDRIHSLGRRRGEEQRPVQRRPAPIPAQRRSI